MRAIKTNIIVLFSLLACIAQAQLKYNDADINFENLLYVRAAKQYETIVQKGDDSQHVLERLGDCYFLNTDMENAAKWYGQLFSKYEKVLEPKYAFRYVHSLKGIGNYKLAKAIMKIYSQKRDMSEYEVAQLKNNDEALDELLNRQPQFYISNLAINTPVADFGPMYYKDKIVFSSSRDSLRFETSVYEWNKQPYLDFFMADTNDLGSDLAEVVQFSEILNTRYHEAVAAFIPEGNKIYFTRNNYSNQNLGRDGEGTNHLKMYTSQLQGGEWTAATEVSFNSEEYSVGQPALSPDGQFLFFVSDMPGSIGNTDIFMVEIYKDGSFSQPKNLGPTINTSGREMFPYVTDEKLYFASDGHLGLGGLDVFESELGRNGFGTPNNLGKPLNSNRDDFAYIVNEASDRGYFSSNREGGKGDDDIYSFQRLEEACEQTVKGSVIRKANAQPIVNVNVELFSVDGTSLGKTATDPYGAFSFDVVLDCEAEYNIKINKQGFLPNEKAFGTTTEKDFINTVPLEITKELNKLIVRENGVLKIKIDNIYFDLNKADIRPDAAQELNKIVEVMKEYPKMVIKIEAHTDSRGSDRYNETLSDKRAKATGNYIISQGIESNRLESAIGYGEKVLLNQCGNGVRCTNEEHDVNRRSEFIIVKME
ncbi:OmpA family protein [Flagellimonas eckloniae]|uniref:Flagellar motor protein MotB n=1 Tax=Flagellimonas eckloniae TaxID=346185 RepID=A0A0Q1BZK7_9FLAO|nr:OmpA family protein [Allomuricauda eckloniae]KQC30277.1 flagellar motor protein MotB [Allomuricauda eckloniae]